ncbi:MAG: hypothetical protein QXR60_03605 [Candidatus Nanoarchaeia archaeon]
MTRISKKREERIKEDILSVLYENITGLSTYRIGEEITRDDEFTLRLLQEMKNKGLVKQVTKSVHGREYKTKKVWALTKEAFEAYKGLL